MRYTLILTLVLLLKSVYGQKDYCNKIEYTYDEMRDIKEYKTPTVGYGAKVDITKTFRGKDTVYLMSVMVYDNYANYSAEGVYLKFGDSTMIRYPGAKLSCKYYSQYGYSFFGMVAVDPHEMEIMTTLPLTKVALHNIQREFSSADGNKLQQYIKCIILK